MTAPLPTALGLAVLCLAWWSPLPDLAGGGFAGHMIMHVSVVTVAAPLLAFGLRARAPGWLVPLWAPVAFTLLELVVVWGWHSPFLHHLARSGGWFPVFEQGSFLLASLLVWLSAVISQDNQARAAAGVGALLLTAMHMTLLGALLSLAPRLLYPQHGLPSNGMTALEDQQLGGMIMLLGAGLPYLLGALLVLATLLKPSAELRRQA